MSTSDWGITPVTGAESPAAAEELPIMVKVLPLWGWRRGVVRFGFWQGFIAFHSSWHSTFFPPSPLIPSSSLYVPAPVAPYARIETLYPSRTEGTWGLAVCS